MSGQIYSSDNGFQSESTPFWRRWLGSAQDAHDTGIVGLLHATEEYLLRMILGIWRFIWEHIPAFWRAFLKWAETALDYAGRVTVRLARVIALFSAWVVITFGPLYVLPGVITFLWMAFAISGFIWGLTRVNRRELFAARQSW